MKLYRTLGVFKADLYRQFSRNRKCGDRCHCTDNNRRLEHIEAECTGIGNLIAKFYAMEIVLTMLLRSRLGFGVSGMQIAADAGTNAGDH